MNPSLEPYAGDVSPEAAWQALQSQATAVLLDVRTRPEWGYVGLPDLSAIGQSVICLEWQRYPSMDVAPDFVADLIAHLNQSHLGSNTPIYFLCRSGVRSRSAAIAVTAAGYGPCYNISGGFEGGLDTDRHRGTKEGWKAAGLPWQQG